MRTGASVVALIAVAVASCTGPRPSVSPDSYEAFLRRDADRTFEVDVTITDLPPSTEPLDIVFLFDATGSMGNVIDAVRTAASELISEVARLSSNARFGVASFADYGDADVPWVLHTDLTSDTGRVVAALGDVRLQHGGDLPEAYARGLYEVQFLAWRAVARRFVVLFGDAPAKDPEFYGENFGIDPGRDGIPGTDDDLRLRPVVGQLRDREISVIAVHDSLGWFRSKPGLAEAIEGFHFMAEQTGGLAVPVASASEVPDAIKAGLREQFLSAPILGPDVSYSSWVDVGAPTRVDGMTRFRYPVTLRPPPDAPAGVHRFALVARPTNAAPGRIDDIGRVAVRVRLGWQSFEWRLLLMPLYVLAVLWLLSRRVGRLGASRYHGNRIWLGLLERAGVAALFVVGLLAIWAFAPGTLPPLDPE